MRAASLRAGGTSKTTLWQGGPEDPLAAMLHTADYGHGRMLGLWNLSGTSGSRLAQKTLRRSVETPNDDFYSSDPEDGMDLMASLATSCRTSPIMHFSVPWNDMRPITAVRY